MTPPTMYTDHWVRSDPVFTKVTRSMKCAVGTCVLLSNHRKEFYVRILAVQPNGSDIIGIVKNSLNYPSQYNIGDLVKFRWEHVLRIHPNSNLQEKRQYAAKVLRTHGLTTQAEIRDFVASTARQTIRVCAVNVAEV